MSYLSYLLTLCSLYQFLSPYQSFVVLSNFCHLLTPCYLFTFYVIFSSFKCACCTHHTHNSISCLIVRTLSAPIYLSNSPGVFGHRAILTMGDRTVTGGFLIEQTDMFQFLWHSNSLPPSRQALRCHIFKVHKPMCNSRHRLHVFSVCEVSFWNYLQQRQR